MSAYTRVVFYMFEAGGEEWAIEAYGEDWVEISETRKNGQEDTHCYAVLERKNGVWEMEEESRENLNRYFYSTTADEVVKFITENGLPNE